MADRASVAVFLVLLTTALAGCEGRFDEMDAAIPPAIRETNRAFFEAAQQGDRERALNQLKRTDRAGSVAQVETISRGLEGGSPVEIKLGGYGEGRIEERIVFMLVTQVSNGEKFYLFVVTFIEAEDGEWRILQFSGRETTGDLAAAMQLLLPDRPALSYLGLAAAVLSLIAVLWSLISCLRSKTRYKWLWVLAIVICYPVLLVNWMTGEWVAAPAEFILLHPDVTMDDRLSPIVFHIGFPIGALAWWLYAGRRRAVDQASVPPGEAITPEPADTLPQETSPKSNAD